MSIFKKLFKKGDSNPFKDGLLVTVTDDNINKRTDIMIDCATKNNLTILCGNQSRIDDYKIRSVNIQVVGFANNFTKHLKEIELNVLIDESVANNMITTLRNAFPNIKIYGGYIKWNKK